MEFGDIVDYVSFGDTTVLQFGLLCLLLSFCILVAWMHYTSKGEPKSHVIKSNYNQKWAFAQILLGTVFLLILIIIGIFASTKKNGTLKTCFEYLFASMIDVILVLLFSCMLFMLIVKQDSPMRQVEPLSQYLTLKERQKSEDELNLRECEETGEEIVMDNMSEDGGAKKIDPCSTNFLIIATFLLIVVGCCLEAFLNSQITDPNN